MSVLVLAEIDNGALSPVTARIVAAAAQLGKVDLLVAGPAAAAENATWIEGVDRVLVSTAGMVPADALARLLAGLAGNYSSIAAAASTLGKDVMPRLAALLDIQPVTDIVAIAGPGRFVRPIYAGNALATLTDGQERHVLSFRASSFAPAGRAASPAQMEMIEAPIASAAQLIASHRNDSDSPDLAVAQIVVAGGVSVGSAAGFKLVEALGATLGAAIGATRAAVDAGYAPNDWQVGQTGKIIAPDLYIAVGISGALQHLAGIQGAKKIIAINQDAEAPIVKIADLTLIGDLFEIVPQLTAALEKAGFGR
ncbi:MAG: hypothetical protein ABS75_29665 [Pelagibacterium sp. SCN 63-23]|nr:MAG: hypothetical protein ABS75_29665 [Pelagibacterium sp. SCN 63-23]